MEQKVEMELNETEQQIFDEDLMKEQFESDLKNAEDELSRGEKNLKEHEFIYGQQLDILKALEDSYELILNNLEVVNPVYKYETLPEYTKLIQAQKRLEFNQQLFSLKEQSIPSMEKTIEAKKVAIKSLKEKIEKMKGE